MPKEYNFVYAVRNINTGEIINKRQGNPFFISLNQAKKLKKMSIGTRIMTNMKWYILN